jgi:hypothetical protein
MPCLDSHFFICKYNVRHLKVTQLVGIKVTTILKGATKNIRVKMMFLAARDCLPL